MITHILCAVDLTHEDDTRAILTEMGRLGQFYDAKLSVITVLPDYGSSWVGSFFKDGTLKEASAAAIVALRKLVGEVLPDTKGVQHIVEIGSPYERVLETIKTVGADLVVVGAHKPEFSDRIIGPNAARIVRNASISTLVVRLGS